LWFDDASVFRRIRYDPSVPNGIFHDNDGTLTGLGPDTWAVHYLGIIDNIAECQTDVDMYDGHICDSTV